MTNSQSGNGKGDFTRKELSAVIELARFNFFLGNRIREIDAPLNQSGIYRDDFIAKLMDRGILRYVGSGKKGKIYEFSFNTYSALFQADTSVTTPCTLQAAMA